LQLKSRIKSKRIRQTSF